jgi:predicted nucleic acid-binding protein
MVGPPQLRSADPTDEPYLDLAAAVKADYLVTRDEDLLTLMTGHSAFCKEFRQKTRPLAILDPVMFLEALRGLV